MKPAYKTVCQAAIAEIIEKKSRFIATVRPIVTEADALALIQDCRSRYHDASHNVYAYVLGDNNIMRYSDDGEPGGTAGMPVLDVIRKEGLIDVAVVVTRYFGGILLGAGGLVRAYSKAAKEGIDAAKIVTQTLCTEYTLSMPYPMLGKIQYTVQTGGHIIKEILYEEQVTLCVQIKNGEDGRFLKDITEVSNGAVVPEVKGQLYLAL